MFYYNDIALLRSRHAWKASKGLLAGGDGRMRRPAETMEESEGNGLRSPEGQGYVLGHDKAFISLIKTAESN